MQDALHVEADRTVPLNPMSYQALADLRAKRGDEAAHTPGSFALSVERAIRRRLCKSGLGGSMAHLGLTVHHPTAGGRS